MNQSKLPLTVRSFSGQFENFVPRRNERTVSASLLYHFLRSRSCRNERRPETMKINHEETKNTKRTGGRRSKIEGRRSLFHLRSSILDPPFLRVLRLFVVIF